MLAFFYMLSRILRFSWKVKIDYRIYKIALLPAIYLQTICKFFYMEEWIIPVFVFYRIRPNASY